MVSVDMVDVALEMTGLNGTPWTMRPIQPIFGVTSTVSTLYCQHQNRPENRPKISPKNTNVFFAIELPPCSTMTLILGRLSEACTYEEMLFSKVRNMSGSRRLLEAIA